MTKLAEQLAKGKEAERKSRAEGGRVGQAESRAGQTERELTELAELARLGKLGKRKEAELQAELTKLKAELTELAKLKAELTELAEQLAKWKEAERKETELAEQKEAELAKLKAELS